MKKIQYPTTSNDSGLLAFRKDSVIDITDPITTMMVAYRRLRMVVTLLLETTHDRFILIAVCYIPQVVKNMIYIHVFCEFFFCLFTFQFQFNKKHHVEKSRITLSYTFLTTFFPCHVLEISFM